MIADFTRPRLAEPAWLLRGCPASALAADGSEITDGL